MDTKLLREKLDTLDKLRNERTGIIQQRNAVLAVDCGQETTAINIGGVRFSISNLNRNYMPETIKGMEAIQAECAKLLQFQIETLDSKILGAENGIKRAASEQANKREGV